MGLRQAGALLLASFLVGCVGPSTTVGFDNTKILSQGTYALLFGNIYGGYRDADGSAEAVIWIVDSTGKVVGKSTRFSPITTGGMRAVQSGAYFMGDQAGYSLGPEGVKAFPREHDFGNLGLLHVLPDQNAIATVNSGIVGGQYRTHVLDLARPERDYTVSRFVDAVSSCGDQTFLLTTEGLSPVDGRWERLVSGEVVSVTSESTTEGLSGVEFPCNASRIFAIEMGRDVSGRVERMAIIKWDAAKGFARSSLPLIDVAGKPLGGDESWDSGERNALHYWLLDGQLYWIAANGEVWSADVGSGEAEVRFALPVPPTSSFSSFTPQDDTVIHTYAMGEQIAIERYSIINGELLDEVVVEGRPSPSDLSVMDCVSIALP